MLAITGAEALYADLGHFSRPAIQARALAAAPGALGREVTALRGLNSQVVQPPRWLAALGSPICLLPDPLRIARCCCISCPAAQLYPGCLPLPGAHLPGANSLHLGSAGGRRFCILGQPASCPQVSHGKIVSGSKGPQALGPWGRTVPPNPGSCPLLARCRCVCDGAAGLLCCRWCWPPWLQS